MAQIINNADDFGYSHAINYGIIDSYRDGVLTSTTLMPGMPGFNHAVALAKQNPGLAIGVHLTLTCGRPVLNGHKTLVNEDGDFKKLSFYNDETTCVDDEEVYREWKAQIEKVITAGIKPTHLDSHHHTHTFKNNPAIVKRLAKEYNLPVRNSFGDVHVLRDEGIICNDILLDPWKSNGDMIMASDYKVELIVNQLIEFITTAAKTNEIIEVMWHPAYLDSKIVNESGFAYPRIYEAEAIKNERFMKFIKENYVLCHYQTIEKEK